MIKGLCVAASIVLALAQVGTAAAAQKPGSGLPPPAARPDLTGYWVSVVTQDWRFRMITPGPGEYAGIPINQAAKAVADAWDPARDEAANAQCRSYGAAGLMRVPGRLHITRVDDHTLKVEMDDGMQTRLLHFDAPQGAQAPPNAQTPPSWQGYSAASWDDATLKVFTDHMRPGYIRKNGVPYSAEAKLTEYWDVFKESDGAERLVITSLLEDPVYLQAPYAFSPIFRRERDGSMWDPTPCKSQ
jgi:hypothetical protein